jgi:ABC-type branched-subunit amino acid transport system permease subunit
MSNNTKKRRFVGLGAIIFGLLGAYIGLSSKQSLGPLFAMVFIIPVSALLGLLIDLILDEKNISNDRKLLTYIILGVVYSILIYKWIHG